MTDPIKKIFDQCADQENPSVDRVVLGSDPFTTYYLNLKGEVLVEDLRETEIRVARNGFERTAILRTARENLGESLQSLLPVRPEDAVACSACAGRGFCQRHQIRRWCRRCDALGWLPAMEVSEQKDETRDEPVTAASPIPDADSSQKEASPSRDGDGSLPDTPLESFKPHADYIQIQQWKSWLLMGLSVFVLGLATLIVALATSFSFAAKWLLPGDLLILGLVVWLAVLWPKLIEKHYAYHIYPHGIEIQKGLAWRRTIFIPRSRLQHADVVQGPVERHFELAGLVLHTAGAAAAKTKLKGLLHEHAARLARELTLSGESRALEEDNPQTRPEPDSTSDLKPQSEPDSEPKLKDPEAVP